MKYWMTTQGVSGRFSLKILGMILAFLSIILSFSAITSYLSYQNERDIRELQSLHMQMAELVSETKYNFNVIDGSASAWIGLGVGKNRMGEQALADAYFNEIENSKQLINEYVAKMKKLPLNEKVRAQLEKTAKSIDAYMQQNNAVVQLNESDHQKAAQIQYTEISTPYYAAINDLDELSKEVNANIEAANNTVLESSMHLYQFAIWGGVLAILLGIACMIFMMRVIQPIGIMAEHVKRVAEGNLSFSTLEVSSKDEIGDLANGFAVMLTACAPSLARFPFIRIKWLLQRNSWPTVQMKQAKPRNKFLVRFRKCLSDRNNK